MKKTKIVASLGSKSMDLEIIKEMALSGVDVFRINLSYLSFSECDKFIEMIKNIEKKTKKVLGIMLDIDGPCIRLDNLKEDTIFLDYGKEVKFYNYSVVCNNTQLSTSYKNLTELVNIGDILAIGSGEVKLEVIDINEDNFITKVIDSGIIKSRQVLHVGTNYLKLPFLSEKDRKNILYAIKTNADFLALSYVRDEQDVLEVVDMLIENNNEHMSILSKIETEEAFNSLEEILKVSDGVIVARGNLGVNAELEKLPFYQKEILRKANDYGKIGLVASDLLKSMMEEKSPSRGEVADIYNAVFDKADGLILCEETEIGEYPVESVSVMSHVLAEAEEEFPYEENLEQTFKQGDLDITSTIAYSVVNSGILLKANCILANTISGYTARKISYYRPKSLILGLSPNKNTIRSLTLNYGVIPVLVRKYSNTDQIISECISKYKEIMNGQKDDIIIITGGLPLNKKNTDFLKIEKIEK